MSNMVALKPTAVRPMRRTRIYIPMAPLMVLVWLLMPLVLVVLTTLLARRGQSPARVIAATTDLLAGLGGLRVHVETPDADIRLG